MKVALVDWKREEPELIAGRCLYTLEAWLAPGVQLADEYVEALAK